MLRRVVAWSACLVWPMSPACATTSSTPAIDLPGGGVVDLGEQLGTPRDEAISLRGRVARGGAVTLTCDCLPAPIRIRDAAEFGVDGLPRGIYRAQVQRGAQVDTCSADLRAARRAQLAQGHIVVHETIVAPEPRSLFDAPEDRADPPPPMPCELLSVPVDAGEGGRYRVFDDELWTR